MTRKQSSHSVVHNRTGHPVYTTDQRVHVERSTVQPCILMHGFTPEHSANNLTMLQWRSISPQHCHVRVWPSENNAQNLTLPRGHAAYRYNHYLIWAFCWRVNVHSSANSWFNPDAIGRFLEIKLCFLPFTAWLIQYLCFKVHLFFLTPMQRQ